jgi:hypothetical protein
MSKISAAELDIAINQLKANTSIQVVSNFLKDRQLASSAGSWEVLINQRILPAAKVGNLSREDIVNLLRSVEEHGRQHVLLYKVQRHVAQQLMSEERVTAALRKFDLLSIYESPKIVGLPNGQVLVDVRIRRGTYISTWNIPPVFHEPCHQSNSSRNQDPAVANFYSAAERRSRGALWPSFAPARIPSRLPASRV